MYNYNKLVKNYFFKAKYFGKINLNLSNSVHVRNGKMGISDVLDFYLLCDKLGFIIKSCYQAYGNPYLIASSEFICENLQKRNIFKHKKIDYIELISILEIPKIYFPTAMQSYICYKRVVKEMIVKLQDSYSYEKYK